MPPDPHVRERVEGQLRSSLRAGDLLPGALVPIAPLARRWKASETPIREACWRAVGEGWLIPEPRGGFRVWEPDVDALRDAYWALEQVLIGVIALPSPTVGPVGCLSADPGTPAQMVLIRLVEQSGNREFLEMVERLFDRLAPFRSAEARLLPDCSEDADHLWTAVSGGSRAEMRAAVRRYCGRRRTLAAAMIGLSAEWRRSRPQV